MRLFLAALAAVVATPASSQTSSEIPDPSSVTLPDISTARVREASNDGWKYFYFHKQGVSFAAAYADLKECYRFLPVAGASPLLPMFVPWTEEPGFKELTPTSPYGLVGDLIGGMVLGPLERRARQSRMRRCLEPRGYVRFALPKDSWERLIDNYSERSVALQAKAASGPRPDAEVVTR